MHYLEANVVGNGETAIVTLSAVGGREEVKASTEIVAEFAVASTKDSREFEQYLRSLLTQVVEQNEHEAALQKEEALRRPTGLNPIVAAPYDSAAYDAPASGVVVMLSHPVLGLIPLEGFATDADICGCPPCKVKRGGHA